MLNPVESCAYQKGANMSCDSVQRMWDHIIDLIEEGELTESEVSEWDTEDAYVYLWKTKEYGRPYGH